MPTTTFFLGLEKIEQERSIKTVCTKQIIFEGNTNFLFHFAFDDCLPLIVCRYWVGVSMICSKKLNLVGFTYYSFFFFFSSFFSLFLSLSFFHFNHLLGHFSFYFLHFLLFSYRPSLVISINITMIISWISCFLYSSLLLFFLFF